MALYWKLAIRLTHTHIYMHTNILLQHPAYCKAWERCTVAVRAWCATHKTLTRSIQAPPWIISCRGTLHLDTGPLEHSSPCVNSIAASLTLCPSLCLSLALHSSFYCLCHHRRRRRAWQFSPALISRHRLSVAWLILVSPFKLLFEEQVPWSRETSGWLSVRPLLYQRERVSALRLWRSTVIWTRLSTLLHLYLNQLCLRAEKSQVQQRGRELKKCLNVCQSIFPSEGACWINWVIHTRCSRRSAIESSWVIRSSRFHFAAMLTDCHSRWRRGVAGENRNFTFPEKTRSRRRDCLHLKLGRSKVWKSKQRVSQFFCSFGQWNFVIEIFVSFYLFTASFIKSVKQWEFSYKLTFLH